MKIVAHTSGISIDTRTLVPGNVFIAIPGHRFDGHDFIESAIEKGASMIVVSQDAKLGDAQARCPIVRVPDTIVALGELANFHRLQFDLPVIGVTGSNGKTTVKTMLRSIFSQTTNPLVTAGNLNNQIGVPLTLLGLKAGQDVAIIEMGANQLGDIRYLCNISKPTIALVNNVMQAHLAGFGSLQGVAQAKGEIYAGLPDSGIAILNIDTAFVDYFKTLIGQRKIISFGLNQFKCPDITAKNITLTSEMSRFTLVTPLGERVIQFSVIGHHNVLNALAASSVAFAAGLSLDTIEKGLAEFSAVEGRLQKISTPLGATLINDTYNANPGSFEAAIHVLSKAQGSTILVMGDMGELGDSSPALHEHIGYFAREKGIDRLWAIGPLSERTVKAFGRGARFYQDKHELVEDLKKTLDKETTCLIKGSRSAKMETVVEALLQEH